MTADLDDYLKVEYDHIAEAHFRTIDTITAFFRHYLLIMSIPISLMAAFLTLGQQKASTFSIIGWYTPVVASIFAVVALAGFGVLLYLVSLRMDALLYARTVNSIRKHFYDKTPNNVAELGAKIRLRVLPQTASQPSYLEWRYFGPVVSVMAIVNSFYLFGAVALLSIVWVGEVSWRVVIAWGIPMSAIFLVAHFIFYWSYAYHREHVYLRSSTIGVDICGVLNEHRRRFCDVLLTTTGKSIEPEEITTVPVHEHPTLGITQRDETLVFNEPEYWTGMVPTSASSERLRSLRNSFRLKVVLFTNRPWPNTTGMKRDVAHQTRVRWKRAALEYYTQMAATGDIRQTNPLKRPAYWLRVKLGIAPIEWITRNWLEYHKFQFDKLIVEKTNDDVAAPQWRFPNRFHVSRRRRIRFFVEDVLENAVKLAYICDVVFLFDHPYNRDVEGRAVPSNVVRVKSWDEVYRDVRLLY
jgi:hypothetical protein